MTKFESFAKPIEPDWPGLIDNILRRGTPRRVYHMELFVDGEVADAIARRFDLPEPSGGDGPDETRRRSIAVRRLLGFDTFHAGLSGADWHLAGETVADTAEAARRDGRRFQDEHAGPITTWEQFEKFPWPDPDAAELTAELEWADRHAPEDMAIVAWGGGLAHFAEYLNWLMGYETLCYALYDQRDLVQAVADKLLAFNVRAMERVLQFDCVKMIWASDDMGFKTGLMISPDDMRHFVLTGHKRMAKMAHDAGRPYLLHACGNLRDIIDDLIDDVGIDAKHSFEDTIEDVREVKKTYGQRTALIGGIDLDFLCRSDEQAIRRRVRQTLEVCMPGGGYCLGTGNSVANYIPIENYLAMVDEGRRFGL